MASTRPSSTISASSRHADRVGQALHDVERGAVQGAGDAELVEIDRHDRLRGEQRQRIDADHDGDLEVLAARLRHLVEGERVARQEQHAEAVRLDQLQAMDGDVLRARFGVARDQEAGGDVGAAVVLVVNGNGQEPLEVDMAMHDVLGRPRRHLPPGQRVLRRVLEATQHGAGRDAHRLRHPAAVRDEA